MYDRHTDDVGQIARLVGDLQKDARDLAASVPESVGYHTERVARRGAELSEFIRKMKQRKKKAE